MRFPASPGWDPLVVVVDGPSPILAEGGGCGSPPLLAGVRWLWVVSRLSWLRADGAVPRHSWLGSAVGARGLSVVPRQSWLRLGPGRRAIRGWGLPLVVLGVVFGVGRWCVVRVCSCVVCVGCLTCVCSCARGVLGVLWSCWGPRQSCWVLLGKGHPDRTARHAQRGTRGAGRGKRERHNTRYRPEPPEPAVSAAHTQTGHCTRHGSSGAQRHAPTPRLGSLCASPRGSHWRQASSTGLAAPAPRATTH